MFGHLACANSIERNPARVNLSPTMGTTSRVRLRGIKFTVLLRVKSVNETFIQSSRLNIIKIEIPKLKGGKKIFRVDSRRIENIWRENEKFYPSTNFSFLHVPFIPTRSTFENSSRENKANPFQILPPFLPSNRVSLPRSTFYTRVPKIRHCIFRFIRRPTPPQFLPTRFSHRIDGIDGGSENWLNEVEGGGAQRPFRDVPNVLAKNRRVCVYLGRVGSIDSART